MDSISPENPELNLQEVFQKLKGLEKLCTEKFQTIHQEFEKIHSRLDRIDAEISKLKQSSPSGDHSKINVSEDTAQSSQDKQQRRRNNRLQGSGVVHNRKSEFVPRSHQMGLTHMRKVTPIFKYLLILDFEATCWRKPEFHIPQEIIEFPCLKLSTTTYEVESTFHTYVQPMVNKQLSPFCTELTGIIQDMVDGQPTLDEVLESFRQWMHDEHLLGGENPFAFVTCGDWDLNKMLPGQCAHFNFPHDEYFKQWINIKKIYANYAGEMGDMMRMLRGLRIPHTGRHHSGIDDCKNISEIAIYLMKNDVKFNITGHLSLKK